MYSPTLPERNTLAPVSLVYSLDSKESAPSKARDYFAEYEADVLNREQRDIAHMMRGNRASFLS